MPEEDSQKMAQAKKITLGLQSEDKRTRQQTYVQLKEYLTNSDDFSDQDLRNIFTETYMHTLNGFRDKTELVREEAIKFAWFLIVDKLPLNDFYLTYVFPILVERIGSVELIETSEEIRHLLLEFMQAIVLKYSHSEQLKPFLNDAVVILCETVKDKFPSIKELSCRIMIDLARGLPRDFHMQAESLVKPTITCFTHQRFKVRLEAINAIGEIIMHSSYNGLNEAVGPLAEKLFDQIPIVRRTVAQVAARWLMEYRDRYSFFHKILPLLLTGLNDEVLETREESYELWKKVGLQYQQENEKELKDQIDFLLENPKYYPENLTRPNLGCRVLVQRNVGKLTNAISFELTSWQEDVRVRTSQLLCSLALHAEDGLTQHMQSLLPAMYSAARDQDQRVVVNIIRSAEIMGIFVPHKTWYKLVLPAIEDGPHHHGHLCVLSSLISGTPKDYICDSLQDITNIISDDSICFTRKRKVQDELLCCVRKICEKYDTVKSDPEIGFHLFKILIALMSLKDETAQFDSALLEDLRRALGMNGVYDLWHVYMHRLLDHVNFEPKSWAVVTPQRCIFETCLLASGAAFGENLDAIAAILVETLDVDADAEARLKTFSALSMAFDDKAAIFGNCADLTGFFNKLITEIFVPSLIWHAGLTAEALRTMAASCLVCALTPSPGVDLFPSGELLKELYEKLAPLLLSLTEDASWRSRQLAMKSLVLLKRQCSMKQVWTCDHLIVIYPDNLLHTKSQHKNPSEFRTYLRRDITDAFPNDPTDKVRHCALNVLPRLLENTPEEFKEMHYRAHHELLIDTLITHFDDDEEVVRDLVFDVLQVFAGINAAELKRKIGLHKPLLRNKKGCEDVERHLECL